MLNQVLIIPSLTDFLYILFNVPNIYLNQRAVEDHDSFCELLPKQNNGKKKKSWTSKYLISKYPKLNRKINMYNWHEINEKDLLIDKKINLNSNKKFCRSII